MHERFWLKQTYYALREQGTTLQGVIYIGDNIGKLTLV